MISIPALFCIDSYKLGHADQYPEGTTKVYSNFTPRSAKHFSNQGAIRNDIVFFGLQGLLIEMNRSFDAFFKQDKKAAIDEFVSVVEPFVGPNGVNQGKGSP